MSLTGYKSVNKCILLILKFTHHDYLGPRGSQPVPADVKFQRQDF